MPPWARQFFISRGLGAHPNQTATLTPVLLSPSKVLSSLDGVSRALPPPLLTNAPQMGFLHGLQEKQGNRRFLFTETEPLERFLMMIPKMK